MRPRCGAPRHVRRPTHPARRARALRGARAMADAADGSSHAPCDPAAQPQQALAAAPASEALIVLSAALQGLVKLTSAPPTTAEDAHAALDAGALPTLVSVLRGLVLPVAGVEAAAQVMSCTVACTTLSVLLGLAEETRRDAATAAAPGAADAVAAVLAAWGAIDAALAQNACHALWLLCLLGDFPGDDAAAAAGRGAAQALAAHVAPCVLKPAAQLASALLAPGWPVQQRDLTVTAAFFDAGGLEALFAAAAATLDDDTALPHVLSALLSAVRAAPPEHEKALATTDACYATLAGAMLRTSLPPDIHSNCTRIATLLAGDKPRC